MKNNRSAVFDATINFAFLYHKSEATCQIDSYKVSNSKFKPELCNYVKTKIIESMAPPQQPHKWSTIFWTPFLSVFHFRGSWPEVSMNDLRHYVFKQ